MEYIELAQAGELAAMGGIFLGFLAFVFLILPRAERMPEVAPLWSAMRRKIAINWWKLLIYDFRSAVRSSSPNPTRGLCCVRSFLKFHSEYQYQIFRRDVESVARHRPVLL